MFFRTAPPDDRRGRCADELQTVDVDATVDVPRSEVELRPAVAERDRVEAGVQSSVHELPRCLADVRGHPDRRTSATAQHEREGEPGRVVDDALVRRSAHGRDVREPPAGGMRLEQRAAAFADEDDRLPDRPAPRGRARVDASRRTGRRVAEPLHLEVGEQRAVAARTPGERARILHAEETWTRPVAGSSAHARPSATNEAVASASRVPIGTSWGSGAPDASCACFDTSASPTEHAASTSRTAARQALPITAATVTRWSARSSRTGRTAAPLGRGPIGVARAGSLVPGSGARDSPAIACVVYTVFRDE